ncbi:MAG: hypothetical protein MUF18_13040, partial [Fimbriiglobus sp.]|nr:hypothetical protein [Fimbriiglobus sp.]
MPFDRLQFNQTLWPKKGISAGNPAEFTVVHTPYGSSALFPNNATVQVQQLPGVPNETTRLNEAYLRWSGDANRKPAVLLAYIGDALKAEQLPLAEKFADALTNQFQKEKDLPADVTAFIKGYTELRAKWNEPVQKNPAAEVWKAKLGAESNIHDDSPHYSIIHFSGETLTGQAGEMVQSASDLLEKNLKSFYLWHLREGFALQLPETKLVVVMAKNGGQLSRLRDGLDGLPLSSDAFYSPAHNLLVLSPERTDDLGRTFANVLSTKLEGYDRSKMTVGTYPDKSGRKPEDIALASTYALIRRAAEDEALRGAISREGSRQLFVSLGLAPQHVRLPQWVESGLGSLFHHPRGGGVVDLGKEGPAVLAGVFGGPGAANYENLFHFLQFYPAKKDARENKSINPAELLTNVLTDKYFASVASGVDPDRPPSITDLLPIRPSGSGLPPGLPGGGLLPPGGSGNGGGGGGRSSGGQEAQGPRGGPGGPGLPGGPGGPGNPLGGEGQGSGPGTPGGEGGAGIFDPNAVAPALTPAQLDQKARATAWALVYYLTKNGKLAKFHSYLGRLNELPRDLRVNGDVSLKLFCETFGLLKPNSLEIDSVAFANFAKEWLAFMH